MNFKTLDYPIVRSFLKQLLRDKKFKKITPPEYLKNRYYFSDKYAFYLGMDAIIKYEQIIEDDTFLNDYVNQLINIFNRHNNYDSIKNNICSLLIKLVSNKLKIINFMSFSSREKILYHIYNKYIVNGYFYFGFSSNYINEIECVGIRRNTFFIDDELKKINDEFKKTTDKLLFLNEKTTITDDFIVACYFSLLSPYYLADMVVNPLFNDESINRECFYLHNINDIKDSLIKVCDKLLINPDVKKDIVNNFIDCYTLSCKRGIKPCIARISRKGINKDKLRDIEVIIKNRELSLTEAVRLIIDSRYNSFNIEEVISPFDIDIVEIPTYQEFLIGLKTQSISINNEELKLNEDTIKTNITANSFGTVSLAFIGLLFIFVGTILALFISIFGG